MTIETVQLDKICRTCLSEDNNMRSVFTTEDTIGDRIRIFEMLMSCTTVQVNENDGLPNQVCPQCLHYITRAYLFKQLCERNDSTLRQIVLDKTNSYLVIKPLSVEDFQLADATFGNTLYAPEENLQPNEEVDDLPSANDKTDNLHTLSADTLKSESELKCKLEIVDNDVKKNYDVSNCSFEDPKLDVDDIKCNDTSLDDVIQAVIDSKETFDDVFLSNDLILMDRIKLKLDSKLKLNKSAPDIQTKIDKIKYKSDSNLKLDLELDKAVPEIQAKMDKLKYKSDSKIKLEKTEVEIQSKAKPDDTNQRLFPCEKCTLCFTAQSDLRVHRRVHLLKDAKHVCSVCNRSFASASTLCRHAKLHSPAKRHLCSECGKGFSRSDDLKRHTRTHTGERPFACKLCDKAFAQSFRLLEHTRAHKAERSFVCAVCGKAFSRYTSLASHHKTHNAVKSHACALCGKRLCGAGSLAMHMKTHTGVRDHVCPVCFKGFTTPSNLVIHKRTHTGERPYVCKECGKGFPDPSRLTVHLRTHSGEKPYVCVTCGRGCVSSSQLTKHMRIHTGEKPYVCAFCTKAFPRSEDLRVHTKKQHTGERSHFCKVCKKGFYQSSTLRVHARIHTGEKPYACEICNKAFSQTGPLSLHMKTHTNTSVSDSISQDVNPLLDTAKILSSVILQKNDIICTYNNF